MNLTIKQIEIMKVVVAGNPDGPTDIDQILIRLPYATTKESLQFSLRALEKHGLIDRSATEHRRGRIRRLVAPSAMGRAVVGGTPRPEPAKAPEILPEPLLTKEVIDELPEPVLVSLPDPFSTDGIDEAPVFEEEVLDD
ncbi:TPA: hypothetical protein QDB10_002261 [Burkholderia vietnamiensis]|nr:hypothetical protein [Burkholderia vietnamiensis]